MLAKLDKSANLAMNFIEAYIKYRFSIFQMDAGCSCTVPTQLSIAVG
jgi:hypothetical protein